MTKPGTATRSRVVERVMPRPAEKIWRALTQGARYGWQRYIGGLERVAAGLR